MKPNGKQLCKFGVLTCSLQSFSTIVVIKDYSFCLHIFIVCNSLDTHVLSYVFKIDETLPPGALRAP